MKVLITGGAGFIGSNLVRHFLNTEDFTQVCVLDNLETGNIKNIHQFLDHPKFTFIQGDIREKEDCLKACQGADVITHQAALGSVPRSIKDPITSHEVNVNGFLNVLEAARAQQIKRVVYASSSSVYGDLTDSPKVETKVGKILSPYAATKMSNELYAEAYAKNYGMTIIGLRYFNVFGPNQDPFGPYAAVIPLFIKAALSGLSPIINGDGTITRDFTPVINVVNINKNALLKPLEQSKHYVFNVACGQTTSLNEIWETIQDILKIKLPANYGPNRPGDIFFSLADIRAAQHLLGYQPQHDLKSFLTDTIHYYQSLIKE